MILHLVLLTLGVLFVWEALQVVLPARLPAIVNVAVLLLLAWLLDSFLPARWLTLFAVVAVAAVLHQKFGSAATETHSIRLPRGRRGGVGSGSRIPPLP